jgi:hypothetical protein
VPFSERLRSGMTAAEHLLRLVAIPLLGGVHSEEGLSAAACFRVVLQRLHAPNFTAWWQAVEEFAEAEQRFGPAGFFPELTASVARLKSQSGPHPHDLSRMSLPFPKSLCELNKDVHTHGGLDHEGTAARLLVEYGPLLETWFEEWKWVREGRFQISAAPANDGRGKPIVEFVRPGLVPVGVFPWAVPGWYLTSPEAVVEDIYLFNGYKNGAQGGPANYLPAFGEAITATAEDAFDRFKTHGRARESRSSDSKRLLGVVDLARRAALQTIGVLLDEVEPRSVPAILRNSLRSALSRPQPCVVFVTGRDVNRAAAAVASVVKDLMDEVKTRAVIVGDGSEFDIHADPLSRLLGKLGVSSKGGRTSLTLLLQTLSGSPARQGSKFDLLPLVVLTRLGQGAQGREKLLPNAAQWVDEVRRGAAAQLLIVGKPDEFAPFTLQDGSVQWLTFEPGDAVKQ